MKSLDPFDKLININDKLLYRCDLKLSGKLKDINLFRLYINTG